MKMPNPGARIKSKNFFILQWMDLGWQPVLSGDGSWSLRRLSPSPTELMHNPRGALTETLRIYADFYVQLAPHMWPGQAIVNVGLGLGWHELALASHGCFMAHRMVTFEVDEYLTEVFLTALTLWSQDPLSYQKKIESLDSSFVSWIYGQIFKTWSLDAIHKLKKAFLEGRWQIWGDIQTYWMCVRWPVALVFYDLFSRSQNPQLWEPDWIRFLIEHWSAPSSAWASFSTWRPWRDCLEKEGFYVQIRYHPQLKKRWVWAWRGYPLSLIPQKNAHERQKNIGS